MIYLPWIAFLIGVAWMIWRGNKAKKEYLRHKTEEQEKTTAARVGEDTFVEALKARESGQRL
ncbi:MAG TPA: hypothetical protein VN943_18875 [Candidatus Acidoferrum sp.]|nr:hypothetical protein [Candidatus Acidoferrum sp.]